MINRELKYQQLSNKNIPGPPIYFREENSGLYSYIFIEDVMNNIVPYSEESIFGNKQFYINISDKSIEYEVKALFHLSYGVNPFSRSLSYAIFDFIRNISTLLLVRGGKAFFEIIDASLEENDIPREVKIITPFHGKIIKIGKYYNQIIPRSIKEIKKRYISIPADNVWEIELPKIIGNNRDIKILSKKLSGFGKASLLGSEIVTNQKEYPGFEYKNFHSKIESSVLKATNKWGWDMRLDISNTYALEYYQYYKKLQFSYIMAILRNDILLNMNELLKRLDYDASLSLFGLPTPNEILDAINRLNENDLSFREVLDLVSF